MLFKGVFFIDLFLALISKKIVPIRLNFSVETQVARTAH